MRRCMTWTLCLLGVWAARPLAADAVILINEVLADPPGLSGDANGDGVISSTQDEFIELVNTDSSAVPLAGWSLSDSAQTRHLFAPAAVISGLGFYVVFGGGNPQGFADASIASTGTLSLNNTGDSVWLRDAASQPIDALTYGAEGGKDVSLTRWPDGSGGFVGHSSLNARAFSPGTTVDGQPGLPPPGGPAVPEPSSLGLVGVGVMSGWIGVKRRRRNS